jgi:GEVED domain/Glycine rich protein/Secretion system C-terminal sorting domain/Ig-like domain CHU_C associated
MKLFFSICLTLIGLSANAQTYCTPTFNSCGSGNYISIVNVGGISNTAVGCSVWDYTSMVGNISSGVLTPMTVTCAGWDGIAVFIDLNNDGDLSDAGELMYAQYTASGPPTTYNFNILVPPGTPGGNHRMRIMAGNGGSVSGNPNPCVGVQWGNYHDYTVYIPPSGQNDVGISSIDSPSVFCPGMHNIVATIGNFGTNIIDSATIHWMVDGIVQSNINFVGTLDTVGGTGSTTASVLLGNYNFSTNNPYNVVAWTSNPNGVPDSITSNDTTSVILQSNLPPPGNIAISAIQGTQATLTWSGGSANSWLWVNVLAGSPNVGPGTVAPSPTATITGLISETGYDFYVREVCPTGDTSTWAGPFFYLTPFECPPNSFCFLTGGQTGRDGPSQAQINTVYSGTNLAGQVTVTGGIQQWTIPSGGLYEIEVFGAQGGGSAARPGGKGARVRGEITLTGGMTLNIVVGQTGNITGGNTPSGNRGGGGGTFVWDVAQPAQPLIAAGGGGGSNVSVTGAALGVDGTDANAGTARAGGGGTPGTGGNGASPGGAGFLTNSSNESSGFPALSALNGATGGDGYSAVSHFGGFGGGGGGGGNPSTTFASGGGGGYSGGAGQETPASQGGGGGGSYNSGVNQDNSAGARFNAGVVIIKVLSSGAPDDIGVISIDSPTVFCPGPQNVVASINNFGITQVTTARVNWTVDGVVQPFFSFTGTLDTIGGTGASSAQVNLGSYNFSTNNAYDIKAWTSIPNGAVDTVNGNDSSEITVQSSLPPPSNVMTTAVLGNQASLSWSGGSSNSWLWVLVPSGIPLSGVGTASLVPNVTIFGLTPLTTYDFYVREVCPTGDTSSWAGPLTFGTPFLCPPNALCFSTCGQTGKDGPSQTQVNLEYAGTPLAGNVIANNGIQYFVVPSSGVYQINAIGAVGGGISGGLGANLSGEFTLDGGDTLIILAGQEGMDPGDGSATGGGGTYVVLVDATSSIQMSNGLKVTPLMVAGGGGANPGVAHADANANFTTAGLDGSGANGSGVGGINGNGGGIPAPNNRGGAGGGFLTNGDQTGTCGSGTESGYSFLNGGQGGLSAAPTCGSFQYEGGFGGGGGSNSSGYRGSGGGGGYSGGGGGQTNTNATTHRGGGGGSLNSGSSPNATLAAAGPGRIIISPLSSGALNDVGVVSIDVPPSFCEATVNIPATVLNFGINQVNSLTLNWSLDNVLQTPVPYTSLLDTFGGSGSSSAQVILGTHNFVAGVPVVIKAWTSNPNGGVDTVGTNDSSEIVRSALSQAVISSITEDEVCELGDLTLSVVSNANTIAWYDDPGLTNQVGAGPSITILGATSTQTRYVRGENTNGCNTAGNTVVGTVSQTPDVDFTVTAINGAVVDFISNIVGSFDSVLWDFSDGVFSNLLNPSHTFTSTGTRFVFLTAYEGSCVDDTSKVLFVNVGLDNTALAEAIKLYPNPSEGQFMLEIPQNGESMKIEIMNLEGKVMYKQDLPYADGITKKEFDLQGLAAGNYLLKVILGGQVAYKRISIY